MRKLIGVFVACFIAAPAAAAELKPLRGLANPSVSFGLSGLHDWMPIIPFIDITRVMRAWRGVSDQGKKLKRHELAKLGAFDDQGWVKKVPAGVKQIETIWAWQREKHAKAGRVGEYVMTYEGSGDFRLTVDAKIISRAPGRIVFRNNESKPIGLVIRASHGDSPEGHLRNIVITKAKHRPLLEAGALFDPDWLELVADARQVRFMDWMHANGSTQRTWDKRPRMDDALWNTNDGIPVEALVRLANEIGADPWFTMPHRADDDYIRAFATYVRDNLDPRLQAHVEYSNELWNRLFSQTKYMMEQAAKASEEHHEAVARRAYEVALIWSDVFAEDAERRLVNVLATWTARPDWTESLLTTRARGESRLFGKKIHEGFDALAVTTYYGGKRQMIDAALKAWKANKKTARQKLAGLLLSSEIPGSAPHLKGVLARQKALADAYGLRLLQYEGGQHMVTSRSSAVGGKEFQNFLINFSYSKEHAEVLNQVMADWKDVGSGPFMQFGESYSPGRNGAWSLYRGVGDTNPRAEAILDFNRNEPAWWGDRLGPLFQHGELGQSKTTTGTVEEDYLVGGAEDDVFTPGPGNDGISGQDGYDTVILSGDKSEHVIKESGNVVISVGPSGRKRMVGIEEIRFETGGSLVLNQGD